MGTPRRGLYAVGRHGRTPGGFRPQTVNLVAAGEATGNLREVLARLIRHFTEQRDLRQKFLASLAYPALICCMSGALGLFLLFFLVPRLQKILTAQGHELPFAARLLVEGSHVLLYFGPFVVAGLGIGAVLLQRWRQTDAGRRQTDNFILKLPVVREFVLQASVLNFTHTLALLLENGVTPPRPCD